MSLSGLLITLVTFKPSTKDNCLLKEKENVGGVCLSSSIQYQIAVFELVSGKCNPTNSGPA